MAELYTQTVQDLITEVKAQFGEEGDVQITDDHVIRWLNRGAREIAIRTQFLQKTVNKNLVAGTPTYDLGNEVDRLMRIDSVFVSGIPLKIIPVAEADRDIRYLDPQGTAESADPSVAWLDDNVLNLHPKPSTSVTNGIRVKLLAYPEAVTGKVDGGGDPVKLPVPDRLYNQLIQFCLAQAQYLDADPEQAKNASKEFEEGMARQSNLQNASPNAEYAQVQFDPDDYAYQSGDGYFG